MKKTWIVYLLLIPICFGFYKINHWNYIKHTYIQASIIKHPEKLPKSEGARIASFGFTNIMADMYWLQTVQYIGGNVVSGEYKKYLHVMMSLITDLNPYFESPYVIGQLLLPSSNESYEVFVWDEVMKSIRDGEKLGLKWIKNFCDTQKIESIKAIDDLQEIISNPKYENPCQSYKIPYYLAFIYYFYLKDGKQASDYYKIVAAQDDAPSGARVLAAIMQGKWGDREKSIFMFLSLARNQGSQWESCSMMTEKLEQAYTYISKEKLPLTWDLIRRIEIDRDTILPQLTEENEDEIFDDTKCSNFLTKATREINLMYLEQADVKYIWDNPDETSAQSPEKLYEAWYIDFIPTDYQQYDDKDYGIIYRYNDEIKRFDYKMWY